MSDARADAVRADAQKRAADQLENIAQWAGRHAGGVGQVRGDLAPLGSQLDALIGGSASGIDRRLAGLIHSSLASLELARGALADAERRARAAAAQATTAARNSSSGRRR